jgi:hypothetical protein
MIGLFCFALAVLVSPFRSKLRLEAENAVLRHQLIALKGRPRGRVRLMNHARWFLIQLYRWSPVAPPAPSECASHAFLVDPNRHCLDPRWKFTHIPLGEVCDPITAGRFWRLGIWAGWPDLKEMGRAPFVCVELPILRARSPTTPAAAAMAKQGLRAAPPKCRSGICHCWPL